jgi:uncharacterized protein
MTTENQPDPITSDPSPVDWDFPPTIATITPRSGGDPLNGLIYISQGSGPHPTVVLLHGFPGDEKNLDLAQAIRRAGWNALFFHYRGAWGSGGTFSVDHALADVAAVLDFARLPASQQNYRIDASRVALVGHSFGAYIALLAGAEFAEVRDIAAIAPANMAWVAAAVRPEQREAIIDGLDSMGHGVIRMERDEAHYLKMGEHLNRYDLLERAAEFDGKSLLFVAASRDEDVPPARHCLPLVERLRARGKAAVRLETIEADHVFSTARFALARAVVGWLAEQHLR